ncbi:hypothetical protein BS50DRAFT_586279 [Corynespora cassiicola Philippines]|uniref:Uncharacterized protein n=1 Tax=Corynespora cassiicola Philippines TaxID=1448308 RepID=A0A2T2NU14_CORCC|nr:hypothetical protein BS50DRAFT_586279 [Corynespora cassiicola Philippines]
MGGRGGPSAFVIAQLVLALGRRCLSPRQRAVGGGGRRWAYGVGAVGASRLLLREPFSCRLNALSHTLFSFDRASLRAVALVPLQPERPQSKGARPPPPPPGRGPRRKGPPVPPPTPPSARPRDCPPSPRASPDTTTESAAAAAAQASSTTTRAAASAASTASTAKPPTASSSSTARRRRQTLTSRFPLLRKANRDRDPNRPGAHARSTSVSSTALSSHHHAPPFLANGAPRTSSSSSLPRGRIDDLLPLPLHDATLAAHDAHDLPDDASLRSTASRLLRPTPSSASVYTAASDRDRSEEPDSPTHGHAAVDDKKMHQTSSRLLRMTDDERPFTRVSAFPLTLHGLLP